MSYAKLTNRGCQNKNKTRSGRLAGNVASLKPNFVCQVERCHNTRERKKTKQREDENDFLGLDVYIFIRTLRRKRLYTYTRIVKKCEENGCSLGRTFLFCQHTHFQHQGAEKSALD